MNDGVLLVGAASPVGRATELALSAAGHRVTATTRSGEEGFARLDVEDGARVEELLRDTLPSSVIYLASPRLGAGVDTATTVARSLRALRDFALRCAEIGVRRIVFASSAAVYGTSASTPRREVDAVDPGSTYAELKVRSEECLVEVSARTSLETLALRIFNVYGPGFSASLVNRLVTSTEDDVPFFNTTQFVRDYIHSTDVARTFLSAVEADSIDQTILNVGTGIGTSNRELLAILPGSRHHDVPYVTGPSHSVADTTNLRIALDFESWVALGTAVHDPMRFFRGDRPTDF